MGIQPRVSTIARCSLPITYSWIVILSLGLLALTGCQGKIAPPPAAAAPPPISPTHTAAPLHIPSRTPTATQTPTVTPPPTVTHTPFPTVTEEPTQRHLRIYDQLYELVLNNYIYPDFNGINWQAWGAIYQEKVAAGMTDDEFHQAMGELVAKLNDGHSAFQSPVQADQTDAAIQGKRQMVGVGVDLAPRPERNTAVVLSVYPNSPAWHAGLRPHDSLLTINGAPALAAMGQLSGPIGATVQVTAQTPGQQPRLVIITRTLVDSPPPVTGRRLNEENLVYLRIRTFWDRNTVGLLRRRLQDLAPISGLVIDLRTNRGGSEYSLEGALAFFADGTLGHFTRRSSDRPLTVSGENVSDSQTVPLIILVGRETSSYAEIFAGVLQGAGRARLVGTVTEGNVETIWPHDFEDNSRVWIAEEGFRPLNGVNWERDGVAPDYYVPADWADFVEESDPQLAIAVELLSSP